MKGTLYLAATLIGDLDFTRRVERILRETDLIAAEDTRRTRRLLSALGCSGTAREPARTRDRIMS